MEKTVNAYGHETRPMDRAKHGDATHVWRCPLPVRIVEAGIRGGGGDEAEYCYSVLAGNQCIGELRLRLVGDSIKPFIS